MQWLSRSEEETREIGRRISSYLREGDILLIRGELGAGKTRLVQGIATGLGISEHIISPTYTLIREYRGRLPLYHVDLYRLEEKDLPSLGLEEYLEDDGVICVEWGEKLERTIIQSHLIIEIIWRDEQIRLIRLEPRGGDWQERLLLINAEVNTIEGKSIKG